MDLPERKKRQRFTEAARAAAARRRKAEDAAPRDMPAVFIIRRSDGMFSWEIRRFGAIPIQTAEEGYATADLARSAGEAALLRMTASV